MRLIAEIGQAHEGSLGQAHAFIDACAQSGINEVKFQTHIAESESSKYEPFRVNFSFEDKSRKDYWKRMEFSEDQWKELKKHCELKKLRFLSTATCIASAELLLRIGCRNIKIGSGDYNNKLLIDFCNSNFEELIFSTGLCTKNELNQMIKRSKKYNYENKSWIFSCNTKYPTPIDQSNISNMTYIKNTFNGHIGHSDHTGNRNALLAATILGAEALEFHIAWDRLQFGPDTSSSIIIREIPLLIKDINDMQMIRSSLKKEIQSNLNTQKNKSIFGKSITAKNDIPVNQKLSIADLECTKPSGLGIGAAEYKTIIGKIVKEKLKKGEFINTKDIF